jgi:hypothetical protein
MLTSPLLVQLALGSTPASQVLGLEDWTPVDGHPLFAPLLQPGGLPAGTIVGSDGCPVVVDLDICADDRFWQTTCGAKALRRTTTSAACLDRFETWARTEDDGLPAVDLVDPRTGAVQSVLFDDYVPERITWTGFDSAYSGHLLALVEPRSPAEQVGAALQVLWWDQNCSVQSCAEFAHEAYDDWSTFELDTIQAFRRGDYRAVHDAAYSSDGIARRPLYASSGEALPPLSTDATRASYLRAFDSYFDGTAFQPGRGELYGFALSDDPAREGTPFIVATHRGDAIFVPFLLRGMGLYPTPLPGEDPRDDDVLGAWLVAFDEACDIDDTSGLLVCTGGDPVMDELASIFSTRLWDWSSAPMAAIPPDQAWPTPGEDFWDVHEDLSIALAAEDDDQLIWLEERMVEFAALQEERAEAWEQLNALGWAVSLQSVGSTCAMNPFACRDAAAEGPEILEALEAVDRRMAALVTLFDDAGCLAAAPTACDWSPRWFAKALSNQFVADRDAAYRTCIARTGDDFRALRKDADEPLYWLEEEQAALQPFVGGICATTPTRAPGERCQVRDDYLDDDATVRAYFDTLDAWGRTFAERWDFPVDPDTGTPTIGGGSSDRAEIGDERFGVVLAYNAGWALGDLTQLPEDLSLAAYGQLQVRTRLFGLAIPTPNDALAFGVPDDRFGPGVPDFRQRRRTGNLAFLDLYVGNGDGGAAWAVFDLLGTEIYENVGGTRDPGADGPLSFHFVANPDSGTGPGDDFEETERIAGAQSTVFVGPVPLDLEVGAAGTVGLTANATIDATGGTTTGRVLADAVFEPSARASVFASASAGIPGFLAAGVDADLTLVRVGLPVRTVLDAEVTADASTLDVELTADLRTTMLAGRVRGFVETPPLWEDYSTTLFRYDGIQVDTPLAHTAFDADLEAIRRAFGIAPGESPDDTRDGLLATAMVEDRGTCAPAGTYPSPDVYLDFDDASITAGTLVSGVGMASLDVSGDTTGREGRHGQAVQLGADRALDPTSTLPLAGDHTISLWYRGASGGRLLAYGSPGTAMVEVTRIGASVEVVVPCLGGDRTLVVPADPRDRWQHLYLRNDPAGGQVFVSVDGQGAAQACDLDLPDDEVVLGSGFTFDELGVWADALAPGLQARVQSQGVAGLPLAGSGSAPLTSLSDLEGSLTTDGVGNTLALSWTNPPSLAEPGFGYDEVVVRIGTDGPVETLDGGIDGYVGTMESTTLFPPIGTEVVHVSTWARGPAGIRRGPTAEFRFPSLDLPTVTDLVGTALDGSTRLTWTLPDDPRVASVRVAHGSAPLTDPTDGALLFAGRSESVRHDGLPNDTPVAYTVWTADGQGRLSTPETVVVTPTAGASTDVTAPGAVGDLVALGSPGRVTLAWTPPPDADPVRTRVMRIDQGVFRRTLATLAGGRFVDTSVMPGQAYTYELSVVDPSNNVGPTTPVTVTTGSVPPVELLTAVVVDTTVELDAVLPDVPGGTWTVVRTTGAIAADPFDGTVVCTGSLADPCVDGSPLLDEDSRYTAFVVADGHHSPPLATEVVRVPSVVGAAGPDRTVYVGERVDLPTPFPDAVWSGSADLVVDATGTWFVPRTPGVRTLTLTATDDGAPVTDALVITAEAWNAPVEAVTSNPFTGDLLAGEGVRGLWSRATDVVAWLGDGDLVAVTDTTITLLHEACPDVVELEGDLLVCRRAGLLEGVDLASDTTSWTAPAPAGTWIGDLRSGVLAFVDAAILPGADVVVADVDPTSHSPRGTFVLDEPTGFPNALALDDDGARLAISDFNRVATYTLTPAAGPLVADDAFDVTDFGTVDLAWTGERLAVGVQQGFPTDALRIVDTSVVPHATLHDLPMPPLVERLTVDGGFVVETTERTVLVGVDGVEVGRYTAASWETGPTVVHDDEVWIAATPGDGIGGDRVFVHPRTAPRPSAEPAAVFDPLDAGLGVVEASTTGAGHWAVRGFDQVVVGDATGVTSQGSVGFTTAPFALSQLLCIEDGAVHYVADDAGTPSVHRSPLGSATLAGTPSFALPPTCTEGVCTEEGLLLRCDDDLVLYALDGTVLDTAPVPASSITATLIPAGDGVLLSTFDSGENARTVWADDAALALSAEHPVPGGSANGTVVGDQLFVPRPGAFAERLDFATGTLSTLPWEDITFFEHDRASSQLTALRRDTVLGGGPAGLVSGSLVPHGAFTIVSADGHTLLDSGQGLYFTTVAPLAVSSTHHRVQPGDALVTTVRWDGQPTDGLALQCRATSGPCDVLSFSPFTRTATVGWVAGAAPGEHALTVFAGTHRWFTSGVDRVVVEAP